MPLLIAPYTTTRKIDPATQDHHEFRHALATLFDEVQRGVFDASQWTIGASIIEERNAAGGTVSFGEVMDLAGTAVNDSVGTVFTQRPQTLTDYTTVTEYDPDGGDLLDVYDPYASFMAEQGKANVVVASRQYVTEGSRSEAYRTEGIGA